MIKTYGAFVRRLTTIDYMKQVRHELRRRNRLPSQRDAEIVALTHLPDVFRRLHEQQLRLPHPHIVGRDRLRRQARRPRLHRYAPLLPWPGRFARQALP